MSESKPSKIFCENCTYLVDATSYVFRAYYAIRTQLKAPDGTPTHATYGFLQMYQALLQDYEAEKVILVWDRKEKGFRHEIYQEYKANRSAPPEDLGPQIEAIQEIFSHLGVPQVSAAGFEADDCIATLIRKNPEENFVIVSSDKDLLQLIDKKTWALDTMKRRWLGEASTFEKFGVDPKQVALVQALSGDSVDNIPGAPGIGPKTAIQLIQYYKSLDAVLEEAQARDLKHKPKDKSDPLKGKRIESLKNNIDQVRVSLQLVTLSEDAPIEINLDKIAGQKSNPDEAINLMSKLGLKRSGQKVLSLLGLESRVQEKDGKEDLGGKTTEFKAVCVDSISSFRSILDEHHDAEAMALDTETRSLDIRSENLLVGLSFCFDSQTAYYVPIAHQEGENLDGEKVLQELRSFFNFTHSRFKVLFQNAKFDLHVLKNAGIDWPEMIRIEDTMVASFVLNPSQSHGMDALAMRYLDGYAPIAFKDTLGEKTNFSEVSIKEATLYAAEDAHVTFRLWQKLEEKLRESSLWQVYDLLDRPLVAILQRMESYGIGLDTKFLKDFSKELHKEHDQLNKQALEMLKVYGIELKEDFKMGSPKQLAKVLYEDLGLPILKKGKTGPSTDVSVLEQLALDHPFPKLILEWRELAKLTSTYVDPLPELIHSKTGRLHTDYSQTIAQTGRLSSNNPNLQNIPIRTKRGKKIRYAFVAEPGQLLVGIDYSQMELRLLAAISQDKELLRAFKENADIHKRTAALILGKPEEEISDEDRRMAKAINFGIIYGQTAFGLSKALRIPKKDAQKFIDDYKKTYPGIQRYMEEAIEGAREKGFVETLCGRRRPLDEIHSKNPMRRQLAERMAINSPIQGTAADLMKAAMIRVDEEIRGQFPQSKMLLQVHDELIFETPNTDAEAVKNLGQELMESKELLDIFNISSLGVRMKTDANIGENWGEL